MECTADGVGPTACLPTGQIGDVEVQAGQKYENANFKFECRKTGDLSMSFDVVACKLPNGAELAVGAQKVPYPGKGYYTCTKNADNGVSRKLERGCFDGTNFYSPGQFWNNGKVQLECVGGKDGASGKASGCLVDGSVVDLGECVENGGKYHKCQLNAANALQADFIQISYSEYREWAAANGQDIEEEAQGDSGSGFNRTTPRPPPPPPAPT
jgi:hypothetical protein